MQNLSPSGSKERPQSVLAESFKSPIHDIKDNLNLIEIRLNQVFGEDIREDIRKEEKAKPPVQSFPFEVLKDEIQSISERIYKIRNRIDSLL